MADALDLLPSADYAACRDIVVSVQVLRSAVDRQIKAHLKGSKVHRRGERVVDHGEQIVRSGEVNNRRQVHYAEERIRHALDVDDTGRRAQQTLPGLRVGPVDEVAGDAQRRQLLRHEAVGAAVEAILGEEMIAGPEEGGVGNSNGLVG